MVVFVFLYNEDFIIGKDLYFGDIVLVECVGDVIFYIVKVMDEFWDGFE